MQEILCKKCGSGDVFKQGFKTIKGEKKQIWKCKEKDCGHKFRADLIQIKDGEWREYSREELSENALYLEAAIANVHTIDQLIAYHNLDMDIWELDKSLILNAWGNSKNSNRQVKGWFKKIDKSKINPKEILETFVKKASNHSPKVKKIKYKKMSDPVMLELGPLDHHLGQLSWAPETGWADYDMKIAEKLYTQAIEYIINASRDYNIEEMVLIMGQDFFNTNSAANTTFGGTVQDEDSRWQKSFNVGVDLLVRTVEFLKQFAKVKVIQVPGNHDTEKIYYAGAYINAWFRNDKNVTVDTRPIERKYHQYGKNLLGFTHGDGIKIERLFSLMPLEAKKMWAETLFREWHKGHLHHESKKIILLDTEESGIKVKTLPSLVPPDAWHAKHGFISNRQSKGFVWHKEEGNIAEFKCTL